MLGNVFEYFLETPEEDVQNHQDKLTILGATSGDTGSAAIAGLRGKKGVHCIILYPYGKVSTIQEQQMTTITDNNIHCVAVKDNATFDDCQDLVKASFNTVEFRNKVNLGAINSINWCRVLAQTTYYFWTYLRVTDTNEHNEKQPRILNFSVPTGNFGDILAGYYAKLMGVPINKLIVATNENDILYRFFTTGQYHRYDAVETISPSMDICVSSNFERYLYYLAGCDSTLLNKWMNEFEQTKKLTITGTLLKQAQNDFVAARTTTEQALNIIQLYYKKYNYLLCPHTACGINAIHTLKLINSNTIVLATAHHGKFPDPVSKAISPDVPSCPEQLAALSTMPTRRNELSNNLQSIQLFVEQCVLGDSNNNNSRRITTGSKTNDNTNYSSYIKIALVVSALAVITQIVITRKR
jgi:threonine synthase